MQSMKHTLCLINRELCSIYKFHWCRVVLQVNIVEWQLPHEVAQAAVCGERLLYLSEEGALFACNLLRQDVAKLVKGSGPTVPEPMIAGRPSTERSGFVERLHSTRLGGLPPVVSFCANTALHGVNKGVAPSSLSNRVAAVCASGDIVHFGLPSAAAIKAASTGPADRSVVELELRRYMTELQHLGDRRQALQQQMQLQDRALAALSAELTLMQGLGAHQPHERLAVATRAYTATAGQQSDNVPAKLALNRLLPGMRVVAEPPFNIQPVKLLMLPTADSDAQLLVQLDVSDEARRRLAGGWRGLLTYTPDGVPLPSTQATCDVLCRTNASIRSVHGTSAWQTEALVPVSCFCDAHARVQAVSGTLQLHLLPPVEAESTAVAAAAAACSMVQPNGGLDHRLYHTTSGLEHGFVPVLACERPVSCLQLQQITVPAASEAAADDASLQTTSTMTIHFQVLHAQGGDFTCAADSPAAALAAVDTLVLDTFPSVASQLSHRTAADTSRTEATSNRGVQIQGAAGRIKLAWQAIQPQGAHSTIAPPSGMETNMHGHVELAYQVRLTVKSHSEEDIAAVHASLLVSVRRFGGVQAVAEGQAPALLAALELVKEDAVKLQAEVSNMSKLQRFVESDTDLDKHLQAMHLLQQTRQSVQQGIRRAKAALATLLCAHCTIIICRADG